MPQSRLAGKRWDSRLEALAWKGTLCFSLAAPAILLLLPLADFILSPKAAAAQWNPTWRLSWESLGTDDHCPTPPGGYCDATLSRRRLCVGPVEIRYSIIH